VKRYVVPFFFCLIAAVACRPALDEGTATPTSTRLLPTVVDDDGEAGARPDLTPLYHRVRYEDCPWGGPGTITIRVKNIGAGDAGTFAVEVNGEETSLPGLAAGQEVDATVSFGEGPVGSITATVDVAGEVAESDENNNDFMIIFTPPPPCDETAVPLAYLLESR
jgi:hypothetical protein